MESWGDTSPHRSPAIWPIWFSLLRPANARLALYVITCSSCGQTEKSAFARVGAVTICTGCKKPIQLRKEDIKRSFRLRTDIDDDLFKVAVVQHSAPEEIAAKVEAHVEPEDLHESVTDEGEHVEEHHDATALAAIAETRAETERRSESARRRRTTPPPPPSLSGAELAQHLARARGRRTLLIVGGLGAVAVVALIFIIAAMSGGNGPTTPPPDPQKDSRLVTVDPTKDQGTKIGPVPDPNKDKSLPPDPTKDTTKVEPPKPPPVVRLKAYPMGIDRWQNINEPYRMVVSGGPVAVLNQTTQVLPDGSRQFRAEVGSKATGASVLATVNLINDEDRVYARFERPLVLLDTGKPRMLELAIPLELARSMATLECSVQPIDTNIASPRLLDDTLAEVMTPGETAVLKLSGLNSSSYVLKETVFVLQAVDETGHVLRQWRMKYPHPVDAKTWVRFEAEVLLEGGGAMPKWRVLAAGLATGEAQPDPAKDKGDPPTKTPVNPDERPIKDPIIRPGRGLFDF